MCGIAGVWWRHSKAGGEARVQAALREMHTRGPDDQGYRLMPLAKGGVVLGHTRLSVIDLSAGGHQPMYRPGDDVGLVFNGEIYNYRELRRELQAQGCQFRSDSDTEVLLEAWNRWGAACIERLEGMFAFAVLDRRAATLTCVRDAFGIKPIYYRVADGELAFASELPALSKLMGGRPKVDWQRAYDYLVHGDYDSGERTFIDGVKHLLPGHAMVVHLDSGVVDEPLPWWTPCVDRVPSPSFAEAAEVLRDKFLDSVRLHLRSDVPLGAALSGGIDSSAIVCAMRHVEPDAPIHTFSFVAQGSSLSEECWIDRINSYVGAVPHKVVVAGGELAADLDDMIRAQGEPFGSTSIYAQYRVFRLAREQGITVTLDGQGADEMTGGYLGYPGQRVHSLIDEGRILDAWRFTGEWARWPGRSRIGALKRVVAEISPAVLRSHLRRIGGLEDAPAWIDAGVLREAGVQVEAPARAGTGGLRGRRMMSELAESLTRRGLPALLRHGDRNSMRFSVESRVPFLTTSMADFLLSLPEEYLVSPSGQTKSVLRAAMRGIVPDDVLDRRDKIGFETPERDWLGGMIPQIRTWLRDDPGLPFLHWERVVAAFEQAAASRRQVGAQAWRWINFCRWNALLS